MRSEERSGPLRASGPGFNEWLEASFAEPVRIRRIDLSTGYDAISPKYGDLFGINAHAKRVKVLVDGEVAAIQEIGEKQRQLVLSDLNRTARKVRFLFEDVWDGTKWHDLCVSEVTFYGNR